MNIESWKDMLADGSKKTPKVISQLLHVLRSIEDEEYLNQVIRISARQKNLKRDLMNEDITEADGRVIQNKITKALLFTLDEIEDDEILTPIATSPFDKPEESQEKAESSTPQTLDDLKKRAKETQELLFTLQDEKGMTLDARAVAILERQIAETEKERDKLKAQIQEMISL